MEPKKDNEIGFCLGIFFFKENILEWSSFSLHLKKKMPITSAPANSFFLRQRRWNSKRYRGDKKKQWPPVRNREILARLTHFFCWFSVVRVIRCEPSGREDNECRPCFLVGNEKQKRRPKKKKGGGGGGGVKKTSGWVGDWWMDRRHPATFKLQSAAPEKKNKKKPNGFLSRPPYKNQSWIIDHHDWWSFRMIDPSIYWLIQYRGETNEERPLRIATASSPQNRTKMR